MAERQKILWLIKGLGRGGAEMLLVNALPYVNREEFEYHVGYFLPWKSALVTEFERGGVPVTCFGSRSLPAMSAVYRYLREKNIAVLHMHLPWAGLIGRIAGRWAGTPVMIYTEHGLWSRLNPLMKFANRATLHWNHATIAVSQDVADSIPRRCNQPIHTIPNGIDCHALEPAITRRHAAREELRIPRSDFVVGKIANLSPVKNHELLIDAFARFHKSYADSWLVLVGQLRGRRDLLMQRAGQLGVAERLVITGPREDVPRMLDAFDVFAMSSNSEGLPVSLLEAMAMAKPVVCTAVGGIPGVVRDGLDGFLVSPETSKAMADRFLQLAGAVELRREMGDSGRHRVREHFNVAEMTRRVEDLYRQVLETRDRTPAGLHA